MNKRGWKLADTAVMAITADELDTARRRTGGSIDALKGCRLPGETDLSRADQIQRYPWGV